MLPNQCPATVLSGHASAQMLGHQSTAARKKTRRPAAAAATGGGKNNQRPLTGMKVYFLIKEKTTKRLLGKVAEKVCTSV